MGEARPFGPIRIKLCLFNQYCNRLLLFVFLGVYWIEISGKLSKPTEAPILVSNHISFVETMFFYYYCLPASVAQSVVKNIPMIGNHIAGLNILVDRENEKSKGKSLDKIRQTAQAAKDGKFPRHIHIYAEGVVTNGQQMISFRTGAFRSGLPIQPVLISYPNSHFVPFLSWMNGGKLVAVQRFFRMGLQFFSRMKVDFLPVYTPNEAEIQDPFLYAQNVRDFMASAAGLPTSQHTFEDALLNLHAKKLNIPDHTTSTLEIMALKDMPINGKIGVQEVKVVMNCMGKKQNVPFIDAGGKGFKKRDFQRLITRDSFEPTLSDLQIPHDYHLFDFFDQNGDGYVDFGELMMGLVLLHNSSGLSVSFTEFATGFLTDSHIEVVYPKSFLK